MVEGANDAGTVVGRGDHATLEFRRHLPYPPEVVWKALTDPPELAIWYLAQGTIDGRVGGTIELVAGPSRLAAWDVLDPRHDNGLGIRHVLPDNEHRFPSIIEGLRTALYAKLAPIANAWNEAMGIDVRYPEVHAEFLGRCHAAGQARPTPLLLQYGQGDYNCLHQDLYGEHVFPIQIAALLAQPGVDFTGGEFVMTEQRPRMQSRPEIVPLKQGDAVAFAVNLRPVQGTRGIYRVKTKHGVSRLRSGQRHTLGIIFHDAA